MTDIWQNLAGQETAKRAIEIAMVGNLPITFVPREGPGYQFTPYDIDRLKGDARVKAQKRYDWYEGEPMSLAAAVDTVAHVRAIADDLAARCGLPALVFNLDTTHNTAAMRVDIFPISCLDFVLPAPQEMVDTVVSHIFGGREMQERLDTPLTPGAQAVCDNWLHHVPTALVVKAIEIARRTTALGVYERNDGLQIGFMALAEAISYCSR